MKYVCLYYPDTLDLAYDLVCDSYKQDKGTYEFSNVRVIADYVFGNSERTIDTFVACDADFDIVILNYVQF